MALQGSLADFNILNILQMIKLEGKTGKLTLSEGDDVVKITFDSGNIIYAESQPEADEGRISRTILSNKLIPQKVWDQIEKEHNNKLTPFWEILARNANAHKLVAELLRRQTVDNVYNALRWKKGDYEFDIMKSVKYDDKVMQRMDVDALLMEGCRLADEMPSLLRAMPKFNTYIVKNIVGDEDVDQASTEARKITGPQWQNSLEREILNARSIELTKSDGEALSVIGEGATFQEIMDSARQGQFDTAEALKRLLGQGIIKVSKKRVEVGSVNKVGGVLAFMVTAVFLASIAVTGGIWRYAILESSAAVAERDNLSKVKTIDARIGLEKVLHGLRVYYTFMGHTPKTIGELASKEILSPVDITDPWGHQYMLNTTDKKFFLYSTGADRGMTSDDIYLFDKDRESKKTAPSSSKKNK